MVIDGKKPRYGQLNSKDRLSDLPDSLLHLIISYLGTKEACGTTILSKRWEHIWSTGFILDFNPRFFFRYQDETVERFVNFTESIMQRYSEKNLSIKMFRLEYPGIDQEMTGRIDRWLGVALQNQVQAVSLFLCPGYPPQYALPSIFFLAKSPISLTCHRVRMPYFENVENVKLISLRILELSAVDIDAHMLHRIIMSCPLKTLKFIECSGLNNLSIPCCSTVESLHLVETVPIGGTILVDTLSFRRFSYKGYDDSWPVSLTPASKKNLKELCIFDVYIKSDSVGKLVSELPSIEIIKLFGCRMDNGIRIASQTLKELHIRDCDHLYKVIMEAPQLNTFCYNGDWRLASVTNSHNNYNAYFHLTVCNLDTRTFLVIEHLLIKSNGCKVLSIIVTDEHDIPKIEFDMGLFKKFGRCPPSEAIDFQELKLSLSSPHCIPEESSCRALIDGLLWCCRPAILSVSVTLESDNPVIKSFLEILNKKVKCWKHPLKRMEIEGTNCSSLLSSWNLEVRLRLHW